MTVGGIMIEHEELMEVRFTGWRSDIEEDAELAADESDEQPREDFEREAAEVGPLADGRKRGFEEDDEEEEEEDGEMDEFDDEEADLDADEEEGDDEEEEFDDDDD